MVINKEIYKIKLTLTTFCNSVCNYCFVNKTNETMKWKVAKKSIDLLLNSPGKEKLLSLYGGEPLFKFDLIKKIVDYSTKKAGLINKNITISICSNLTIISDKIIDFIKKNNIKITVSIVGEEGYHNKFRKLLGGKDSYQLVINNLKLLARKIPEENIGISFVIIPSLSSKIENNFKHILELNVSKNINFEIIQKFEKWKEKDINNFKKNCKNVYVKFLNSIINKKKKIYMNPVTWELIYGMPTEINSISCPFKYSLEIYPSGDMAFSPFLLNRENKKDFIVGNVLEKTGEKYLECSFESTSSICKKCESIYYANDKRGDGAYIVKRFYDMLSIATAEFLKEKHTKSAKNFFISKYLKSAQKRCF